VSLINTQIKVPRFPDVIIASTHKLN